MYNNAWPLDESHQVALKEIHVLKQGGHSRACMPTFSEGVRCTLGLIAQMSIWALVSGGFWSGFGPENDQHMVAYARHTKHSTTHTCCGACYVGAAISIHRSDSSFQFGAIDHCRIWPRTTHFATRASETSYLKLYLDGTLNVSRQPASSTSRARTSRMNDGASVSYAKPEYGYAKLLFEERPHHVSAFVLCTLCSVHDTQYDPVIFQVTRAFLLHSSRGPGFVKCCTVLSMWFSSCVDFRGQSLWGSLADLPPSGLLSFKLLAVRSLVTAVADQQGAPYPVQDDNPTLRYKCSKGAGVSYGLNTRRLDLQQCFTMPFFSNALRGHFLQCLTMPLFSELTFAEFLFRSLPGLNLNDSANLNRHRRMQACVTKALAAMGWGGKGKGASWSSTPWTPPQWTAPTAESPTPPFVPQEEGPGATRFAYSLLYKEREKMNQVLEEQRKKDEKQEREQEFQKLRQELLSSNKQPSIEDSIYRTMIADNQEKKPQAESQEQDNKGMFGTMLKMMRAMTGSKDSKDHTPTIKAKKKRRRSSSSSRSTSSEKPKKKHRSSKAASSKDKKKEPTKKARRHSSSKTVAASSDNPEDEESDEVASTPLPLKIPKRAAPSSAAAATSQSNRKSRGRQFDLNVQSMVKTYCKAGDEIDIPKLDDQEAIDTFTEEMCTIMKKYKVTVAEINQVLASNTIPLAKGGKTLTKQQKIEAILMHNVEPLKKANKTNEGSDE